MIVYEIPLASKPISTSVIFPSRKTYVLRLIYLFTPNDCWELDVADAQGVPLVEGIALITGADLFAQYGYLNFGCALYVTTDVDADAVPRFYNLGAGNGPNSHLWLAA